MTSTCRSTIGLIDRVTMISGRRWLGRPLRSAPRRASADRVFVYWAVGSCLLVFLALILALVVSGKLRALTAAIDQQSGQIDSLAARVRDLEARPAPASRPAVEFSPPTGP